MFYRRRDCCEKVCWNTKGYYGNVEYSREDALLYGKVLGINSLISYEGESVAELQQDFEGAVDDYLEVCAENGTELEKAYKGSFNVRIAPQLHKKVVDVFDFTKQVAERHGGRSGV